MGFKIYILTYYGLFMILRKLCRILDDVLLTHLRCGPRTSTCLKQYSILICLLIVSFKTFLDLQVKITSSTCNFLWIAELNPYLLSLIQNLQTVKIDKKFSKLCRLRHLSIFKYKSHLPPVKFLGLQH